MSKVPDLGRILGPIVISNAIEVDLVWNLANGRQVKNVLHGQVAGGFAATAAIAEAVRAAIVASAQWTAWKPFINASCSFQGVNLRDLRLAQYPLVNSTGGATAGTGVGTTLQPGASIVVTERTAFAGRSNRGRVYLTGLDSAALTAATGAATAAANTAALNFMTAVQTALGTSGITLAIANPARAAYTGKHNRPIPARPAGIVPVTGFATRLTTLASQRRRAHRV